MAEPIVLFHTEEFKFERVNTEGKEEESQIIISGNAQPLNEDSRNGVRYRPESVKAAHKSLEGVAFLNGHDATQSLGHVISVDINDTHITYRADVDPEEKEYIRKAERGDIRHVSVGCMVENVEFDEDENIFVCDVKEYVELSAVTVPGFANTSANKESAIFLANAIGDKNALEKLNAASETVEPIEEDDGTEEAAKGKPKDGSGPNKDCDKKKDKEETDDEDEEEEEKDKDDEDEKEEEADDSDDEKDDEEEDDEDDDKEESIEEKKEEEVKTEEDEEPTVEEMVAKVSTQMEELFSKFDEINNRLSIVEANVDAINESEEDTEAETPEEETEELKPDASEKFTDEHTNQTRAKENIEAKEKALFGETTKKVNGESKVIDMRKTRMNNISY